ncbi:MAG: hypothetical protein Q8R11_03960, partial [bacterium]|nr:hypothetical protein [bacterium]
MKRAFKNIWGWPIVLFGTWGIYFALLWPKMLFWNKEEIWAGWIGVWADWSVHFTYASVFAYRPIGEWFIGHPLFVGRQQFSYPFVADAISGLLIRLGLDPVFVF